MKHVKTGLLTVLALTLGASFALANEKGKVPLRKNTNPGILGFGGTEGEGNGSGPGTPGAIGTLTAGQGLQSSGDLEGEQSEQIIGMKDEEMRRPAGSDNQGVVQYVGHFPIPGSFYGGSSNPTETSSSYRLSYEGAFAASEFYATQYFYFSDRRMKTDIEPMSGVDGLNMVGRMSPVFYSWQHDGRDSVGLIAQDVEATHPFMVSTDSAGYKSVDYIQVIAPLISSVQELEARNRELSARVEALEAQ